MAMDYTSGMMVDSIKENGGTTKWKARGNSNGMMAESIQEITRQTRKKAMGSLGGKTAECIEDIGKKVGSMVVENTLIKTEK
jgi:hypothetical protein